MILMAHANVMPFLDHMPSLAEKSFVATGAQVIGRTTIGNCSSIWFNTTLRGDVHEIKIGEYTNVQDNSIVHVTGGKFGTTIGDRVTIGHGAVIHGCTIEDDVLIGMGAIILDGAVIPKGSMVAAGSIVTQNKTFIPGSMIMGSPAKVVRELKPEEREWIGHSAKHYWDLASKYDPS